MAHALLPLDTQITACILTISDVSEPAANYAALNSLSCTISSNSETFTYFLSQFALTALHHDQFTISHPHLPVSATSLYILKKYLQSPPQMADGTALRLHPGHTAALKSHLLSLLLLPPSPTTTPILQATTSLISLATAQLPSNCPTFLPISEYPELLQFLLSNPTNATVLSLLNKMSSDNNNIFTQTINNPVDGSPFIPLNALLPLLYHPVAPVADASILPSLYTFTATHIPSWPSAMAIAAPQILSSLASNAGSAHPPTLLAICETLAILLEWRGDVLSDVNTFASVVMFMAGHVVANSVSHYQLSIAATEFFHVLLSGGSKLDNGTISTFINDANIFPTVLRALVKNMRYSESEVRGLMQKNEEDVVNDVNVRKKDKADQGDDEDDGDEDVDFEDGEDSSWTVRKVSAATLDWVAVTVPTSISLPVILQELQNGLRSDDVWVRESCILALGAISAGQTGQEVEGHLTELYPFLISQLSSSLPQLVEISCWTMSRYVGWVVYMEESGRMPNVLSGHVTELMKAMMLPNRNVQNAAVTSLSKTIECAGGEMIEVHLGGILGCLTNCLGIYGGKPLMTLCETFGVVADYVGEPIGQYCGAFVPPLLEMWRRLDEGQRGVDFESCEEQAFYRKNLVPLLECIGCVTVAAGASYQPFAAATLTSAMSAVEHNVLRVITTNSQDENDSDVIVCCLDIIDGLIEAFSSNFAGLMGTLEKRKAEALLPMVQQATEFGVAGVRMSAFAVLGDLSKHCPSIIQGGLGEIFGMLIGGLNKNRGYGKVLNNVLWACGELFVRCKNPPDSVKHTLMAVQGKLLSAIWELIMGGQVGIAENAGVAMGRLAQIDGAGFGASTVVGQDIALWLGAIGNVYDRQEKADAFLGCIQAIMGNSDILMGETHRPGSLSALFMCIASFHVDPQEDGGFTPVTSDHLHGPFLFKAFPGDMVELDGAIRQLLGEVRRGMGPEFGKVVERLPGNVRKLMQQSYS